MNAVLYCAKSTADVRGSLATQLEDCRRMADEQEWTVVGEFQDEGVSGWSSSRGPGLAAARQMASDNSPCVLAAQHSDRLARGAGDAPGAAEHLAEVMFWARRHGVELRSVEDDSSLTNPLLAFVMGERNYEDSKRKSQAVAAGMRRRRDKGLYCSGVRPFGYDFSEPGGPLVVREDEARMVRWIVSEYLSGRSLRVIAQALNTQGVTGTRGGRWFASHVGKMLDRPLYRGELAPAIVDPQAADRVDELRAATKALAAKGAGRKPSRHLFVKGFLRCAACGSHMRPYTQTGRSYRYEAYRCTGRDDGRTECLAAPVPRMQLDACVVDHFRHRMLDVEATRADLNRSWTASLEQATAARDSSIAAAMSAQDQLLRLDDERRRGELTPDEWRLLRPPVAETLDAAQAEVDRQASHVSRLETSPPGDTFVERWASLREAVAGELDDAGSIQAMRASLQRVFRQFAVGEVVNEDPQLIDPELGPSFRWRNKAFAVWMEPLPSALYEGELQPVTVRLRNEH